MCQLYFAAICENLLFIHHTYKIYKKTDIHTYVVTYGHRLYAPWDHRPGT